MLKSNLCLLKEPCEEEEEEEVLLGDFSSPLL
jgi:hypothetical protein